MSFEKMSIGRSVEELPRLDAALNFLDEKTSSMLKDRSDAETEEQQDLRDATLSFADMIRFHRSTAAELVSVLDKKYDHIDIRNLPHILKFLKPRPRTHNSFQYLSDELTPSMRDEADYDKRMAPKVKELLNSIDAIIDEHGLPSRGVWG